MSDRPFVFGRASFAPTATTNVTPLFTGPRVISSGLSPAERVLKSHKAVEAAAQELTDGSPGSGVKALCFAAATHLALSIGSEEAKAFFQMIAGVAGEVGKSDPEPAA